ncbi:MAG: 8-oxoguanine deaminase [Bacillota bacterium]
MKMLIRNADWIVTMNPRRERIRGGNVLIDGCRIAALGRGAGEGEEVDRVIDASGMVVLPGFVNTHHHLYQTLTRAIPAVQDVPLFPWLVTLYEIWREITPEAVYLGALVGLGELLKSGCTTSTDHHYVFPRCRAEGFIEAEIEAARQLGIRFHPTRGSMSLGRSRGGLPPDEVVQDEDAILADCERLLDRHHDPARYSMCRLALAPCSPFSVTPRLMREAAGLARSRGVLLHTHLAETRDEERFCLEKFGCRPVAYVESLGWLGPDVWFAHAIHLDDREVRLLGETRTGVAHCPVSNMKLASGICRVRDLLEAGARVGLAVDGSASNDSSGMWGEIRVAYLLQKLALADRGLSSEEVLYLATAGGAAVLGRDDIGYLDVDMAADMILIDLGRLEFAGTAEDPVVAVVATGPGPVDTVIVNGRVVLEHGRLVGMGDEREVAREATRVSREMVRRASARTGIDYLRPSPGLRSTAG